MKGKTIIVGVVSAALLALLAVPIARAQWQEKVSVYSPGTQTELTAGEWLPEAPPATDVWLPGTYLEQLTVQGEPSTLIGGPTTTRDYFIRQRAAAMDPADRDRAIELLRQRLALLVMMEAQIRPLLNKLLWPDEPPADQRTWQTVGDVYAQNMNDMLEQLHDWTSQLTQELAPPTPVAGPYGEYPGEFVRPGTAIEEMAPIIALEKELSETEAPTKTTPATKVKPDVGTMKSYLP